MLSKIKLKIATYLSKARSNNQLTRSREDALLEGIEKEPLKEITINLLEAFLDSKLADGVIRSIPILKTIYSITRGVLSVRDYLFSKKIYKFLIEMGELNPIQRQQFFNNLPPREKERFAETLLMLLDKITDMDKAVILGMIWRGCINGDINYDEAQRLSHILDIVFIDDIATLRRLYSYWEEDKPLNTASIRSDSIAAALVSAGLLINEMPSIVVQNRGSTGITYRLTNSGMQLARIVNKYLPKEDG